MLSLIIYEFDDLLDLTLINLTKNTLINSMKNRAYIFFYRNICFLSIQRYSLFDNQYNEL
jgi:hypothetical protein